MSKVLVRFYRLTARQSWRQGKKIFLFWLVKKIFRLGYYGHCSIVVEVQNSRVEYTLLDGGVVCVDSAFKKNVNFDEFEVNRELDIVLTLIQKYCQQPVKLTSVNFRSLARAFERPNCYHSLGCCTHFLSYVLYLPPTTLADELCRMILFSDTKRAPIAVPKTTSEYGEMVGRIEKNATASVATRLKELSLLRKLTGLFWIIPTISLNIERFSRIRASNMMFSQQDPSSPSPPIGKEKS